MYEPSFRLKNFRHSFSPIKTRRLNNLTVRNCAGLEANSRSFLSVSIVPSTSASIGLTKVSFEDPEVAGAVLMMASARRRRASSANSGGTVLSRNQPRREGVPSGGKHPRSLAA